MGGRRRGRSTRRCALLALLALCGLLATPAQALTDEELFLNLRYDLLNAGARGQALGGAYTAVGDDLAAVTVNPAGLNYLDRLQVFGEFRHVDVDDAVRRSTTGSLAVDPATGDRDLPFLSVTSASATDAVSDLGFVGFAAPLRFGASERKVTLFGYRQLVLSEDRELAGDDAITELRVAFEAFPTTVNGGEVETYSVAGPVDGESSIEVVHWGVGAALEVHPDFAFGVQVALATLDISSRSTTTLDDPLELFVDPVHPRLSGQPNVDVFESTIDASAEALAWSFGVHWHPNSVFSGGESPWRIGAVFRRGARFDFRTNQTLNGVADGSVVSEFIIPDRYNVGVSYHRPDWVATVEVERVEFSDLLEGFDGGVSFLTGPRLAEFFGTDPNGTIRFDVDDAIVPRLGGEYRLPLGPDDWDLRLRGGFYRVPDSRLELVEFNSLDDAVDAAYRNAFGSGEDDDHVTLGAGLRRGKLRVDLAADVGDESTSAGLSISYELDRR